MMGYTQSSLNCDGHLLNDNVQFLFIVNPGTRHALYTQNQIPMDCIIHQGGLQLVTGTCSKCYKSFDRHPYATIHRCSS